MFLGHSPRFHSRTGSLVVLSNGNRTAKRTHASQEFNNGLVFSAEPLADNQLFQVKIDKKIPAWSGSIEIGLTSCDPSTMNFPTSATGFTSGTWIMSGNAVLKDGRTLLDSYGWDLDRAMEEDRVGILRTSEGVMHVYFNGVDQGAAALNLPARVWAVFDMYGKCAQISIVDERRDVEELITNSMSASFIDAMLTATMVDSAVISLASSVRDVINTTTHLLRRDNNEHQVSSSNLATRSDPGECDSSTHERVNSSSSRSTVDTCSGRDVATFCNNPNRLTFHERHGTLIKLSLDRLMCERLKPLDEFNNGVVMTNRPIKDDELFEIRLDRLVDKWSGSIEVGITTHNPNTLEFPATMTNMRSGTIMMSGNGILTNGKGTRRQYGSFNLDELEEGNTIGLVRKSSGTLHYFINSIDQGVAATKVPEIVWGVVDLYGMAVKVTIINHPLIPESSPVSHDVHPPIIDISSTTEGNFTESTINFIAREPLLFHMRCGHHSQVVSNQKTALRPNAMEDFNNAVVLTQRCLEPEEMFEVCIDRMVEKWAGSIEIGVTTHSPTDFEFPSTMTNVRSGTWMMTGNGVMHNGVTILENYGHNLDKLKAGDRVGALRKMDGSLHFYVNGFDQGLAATSVPPNVFGVVDLYGQAAMATIINPNEAANLPETASYGDLYSSLSFQPCRSPQVMPSFSSEMAIISEDCKTVCRQQERRGQRVDGVVISSRPLRANELFEVVVVQMAAVGERSIEAGVKWFGPMDGRSHDQLTWMLSGTTVVQGDKVLKTNYTLDLDAVKVRSKVGLMARADGSLHFFLNGLDKGPACFGIPKGVYGVISLIGRGTQVSIVDPMMSSGSRDSSSDQISNQDDMNTSVIYNEALPHQFSPHYLRNIDLSNNSNRATRLPSHSSGWVCSAKPLKLNEPFEILVEGTSIYSGGFQIGITSSPQHDLLLSDLELKNKLELTLVTSDLYVNGKVAKEGFCSNLDRLSEGDRVGMGIGLGEHGERKFHFFINGTHVGAHILTSIPKAFYAKVKLNGKILDVSICFPSSITIPQVLQCATLPMMMMSLQVVQQDRMDEAENVSGSMDHNELEVPPKEELEHLWSCCIGDNIELMEQGRLMRINSFNQGVVVLERSLAVDEVLKVKIETLEEKWTSSLKVGFLLQHCNTKLKTPKGFRLPQSSLNFRTDSCIFSADALFINGFKVPCISGDLWNLDDLVVGDVLSLSHDLKGQVHLGLNGAELATVDVATYLNALHNGRHFCFEENKDLLPHYLGHKQVQIYFPVVDLYGKTKGVKVTISAFNCKNEFTPTPPCFIPSQASEGREKADIENESKEKSSAEENVMSRVVDTNDCKFFQICTEVKASLSLPDGFFHDENLRCYCESCHKLNGEGLYFRKGEPPRDYATPVGWAAFPLRHQYRNESVDTWHTAYHGLDVSRVRRILDSGDIVLPSDQLFGGRGLVTGNVSEEKSAPEDMQDIRPVILSPTIKYASLLHFSPKMKYVDEKTKRIYWAQLSLQVSLKPGSYKVSSQSVGLEGHLDSRFANSELEWLTKEQKAVVLNSLLIRVEAAQ